MKNFRRLCVQLKKLPGIGPKQAERMALYLLRAPAGEVEEMIASLRQAKAEVRFCPECFNLTESPLCSICSASERDHGLICVVEEPQDVSAIERAGTYNGVYHVLHGALSPLDGIGPESLKVAELVARLKKGSPASEVILATDPDTEGDTTALYLAGLLKEFTALKTTRIAQGVPLGGDLDYIDERTLAHALSGRKEMV